MSRSRRASDVGCPSTAHTLPPRRSVAATPRASSGIPYGIMYSYCRDQPAREEKTSPSSVNPALFMRARIDGASAMMIVRLPIPNRRTASITCLARVASGSTLTCSRTFTDFDRVDTVRSAGFRVGIRSPRNREPNQLPASHARIWVREYALTGPEQLVVLSSVESCMTTG